MSRYQLIPEQIVVDERMEQLIVEGVAQYHREKNETVRDMTPAEKFGSVPR